jgi:hypothetical protein
MLRAVTLLQEITTGLRDAAEMKSLRVCGKFLVLEASAGNDVTGKIL